MEGFQKLYFYSKICDIYFIVQNLKKENARLQEILLKYESDTQQKQEIISKLNAEAEEQKKQIELFRSELMKSKENIEKAQENTSEVHQNLISKISDLEAKYAQMLEEKRKVWLCLDYCFIV